MTWNQTALLLGVWIALPGASMALERTAVPLDQRGAFEDWNAGATCTVSYYNNCTGWIWTWGSWEDGDVVGVLFDACSESGSATLMATNVYAWRGAICNIDRGYTGLISIQEIDDHGCPGNALASQPFLPCDGDNVALWDLTVSGAILLTVEQRSYYGSRIPTWYATDHPSAGPTGPQACGLCYPADRVTRSFMFGTATSPLCPGSPLYDGVCNAEFFRWSAAFITPLAVETTRWSQIKALYR